jgi:hypothetical protein
VTVTVPKLRGNAALPSDIVDVALDRLFPEPTRYATDPVAWAKEKLNRHLWSKQIEIMDALRNHRLVAVKSCHGPGKSFSASCAGAWWLDPEVHSLGSAFLVTTAPSYPQVEQILWRELRRRHNEGKLRGRITLDCQWHMGEGESKRSDPTEEIIGIGRKPQDYDEDTFQGIHARYFMAILDEACGIPEALWNSVLALATNENSRILAIGNPDDPNSRFAKICKPGSGWHVIQISVWDTPNFTQEVLEHYRALGAIPEDYVPLEDEWVPDEVAEGLTSSLYVDTAIREWGIGSPIWQSKVNGEFPDVSDEYLISPTLIERAHRVELAGLETGRYGLDVARFGHDKSVLYRNRGGQVRLIDSWGKLDTMQTVGRVRMIMNRLHPERRIPINIDVIGVGSGVYDRMRELNDPVAPYQGSQRAINPAKFKNRRSETWWTFREWMEAGLIDLDPADEKLAAELGSVKWGTDSSGRIYIETKEDMIARGLPSPNNADAAVMSLVAPAVLSDEMVEGMKRNRGMVTSDLLHKVM